MDINIGEMTAGDILGRGMNLLFKRLPYFYAIQVLIAAPTLCVQLASPFLMPGTELLVVFIAIVLAPIGSAAMLRIIVQEYLDGEVSLSEAFQFALGRFLPLLGTSLVFGMVVALGMLACCIPGIYLAVVWSMMSQIVVVENLSGTAALSRSKKLTEGYFGHVFTVLLLLGIFQVVVAVALNLGLATLLPFQEFVPPGPNPLAGVRVTNYTNFVLVNVAVTLVNIFLQAYAAVSVTLMYFDLRNRKEGYDLPVEFAKIARWRERSWDDDDGALPPPGGPAATGIKEPGTALPPQPGTGIQGPTQPPETGIQGPPTT